MASKSEMLDQTIKYLKSSLKETVKMWHRQPSSASGYIIINGRSNNFESAVIHLYVEKFLKSCLFVRCSIAPDTFTPVPGNYIKILSLSDRFYQVSKQQHISWIPVNATDVPDKTTIACSKHFKNPYHQDWLNSEASDYLASVCQVVRLALQKPRIYSRRLIASGDRAFQHVLPNRPVTQAQGQALNDKLNLILHDLNYHC